MDTGDRRNDREVRSTGDSDNVLRFPRDWFGPVEELVPFGPRANEERPNRDAEAFWGEQADEIHEVVPAVSIEQVDEPPGRVRRHALHVLAACGAALACGVAMIGRIEGPARTSADRLAARANHGARTSSRDVAPRPGPILVGESPRSQLRRSPGYASVKVEHRTARRHHTDSVAPTPRVVVTSVSTPPQSSQPAVNNGAPAASTPVAYTGANAASTAVTSAAGGGGTGGGTSSAGGSSGGGGSSATGSGSGSGASAPAGPEGPGAPFGPGHIG